MQIIKPSSFRGSRHALQAVNGLLLPGLILLLGCVFPAMGNGQISLNGEAGVVTTGYNNVGIPGNSGTRFSMKDDLKGDPIPFFRLRAKVSLTSRHHLVLLYAPLELRYHGTFDEEVLFRNVLFEAGKETEGTYKFNSYRLTYRYRLVQRPKLDFDLGLTAKIRDASIGLNAMGKSAIKTDLGFVPIIHFRLHWMWSERYSLLFEGDALASPFGRAEDVLLASQFALSEQVALYAGYRLLEGGTDGSTVYNFSMFHYITAGCVWQIRP